MGLVGFKGKKPVKDLFKILEEEEHYEMVVGVGFIDNKEFIEAVPFIKKIENQFLFNRTNLIGYTLGDGVMDLFLKEKIKLTKLASLAFVTYYSNMA